jgi:hypothetical protein
MVLFVYLYNQLVSYCAKTVKVDALNFLICVVLEIVECEVLLGF